MRIAELGAFQHCEFFKIFEEHFWKKMLKIFFHLFFQFFSEKSKLFENFCDILSQLGNARVKDAVFGPPKLFSAATQKIFVGSL